jgi:hypothetical protein
MTKFEELFYKIAEEIPETTVSKMFGALCIKAPNGKAGVMFWKDDMIFKPGPDHEAEAMALKGAKIFTPAEGRPMNGWIQVPNEHSKKWKKLAERSMDYVKSIEAPKKVAKKTKGK